jgi:hypothetical protein
MRQLEFVSLDVHETAKYHTPARPETFTSLRWLTQANVAKGIAFS